MNLTTRKMSIGPPATIDEKTRSVEVIGATETPVDIFDWQRYEVVPEVLMMGGLEMPGNRQVPLLDTHNGATGTAAVLGSFRDMRAEDGQLTGRVFFSSAPEAAGPFRKLQEGHLTDFSVGYRVVESTWIDEGRTLVIKGRSFDGPVRVTTRWRVKELSVVPIGADVLAKARADAERSQQQPGAVVPLHNRKANGEQKMPTDITANVEVESAIHAERSRVADIEGCARKFSYPAELTRSLTAGGVSIDEAFRKIQDHHLEHAAPPPGYRPPVSYGQADDGENRAAAMTDGLVLRAGLKLEHPAEGAAEFRGATLADIAKTCLAAQGVRVSGLGRNEIVSAALAQRGSVTGDFPSLLANVGNKVLRQSYEQAPGSFAAWTKVTAGADFKEMSRVQLSEAPDLDRVPEHGEFVYGKFGDSKEVFSIFKYGKLFAITREAIVNDDLAAFTRIPQAFAMSAKRKINSAVYSILTTNANMGDGKPLFDAAAHLNYKQHGAGSAPGLASLGAARLAMRLQAGLNGAVLNISPKFLIVPAALETISDQLLNSTGDMTPALNQGVANPFYKKLELIVESLLDGADPKAWFVAADPGAIDTIEVCFLGGNQVPYLETRQGWSTDGTEFKCRIEFGVKALDWRGLFCDNGD